MYTAESKMRPWKIHSRKKLRYEKINDPLKWRKADGGVDVCFDPFALDRQTIDHVFAVMASCGWLTFVIKIDKPRKAIAYLDSVVTRGKIAGPAYEQRMRAHFDKYKREFIEGYSLPGPPTPELRALYDAAAKAEKRPINPCGSTLRSGFSGGEYHWRPWPLDNVRYAPVSG